MVTMQSIEIENKDCAEQWGCLHQNFMKGDRIYTDELPLTDKN